MDIPVQFTLFRRTVLLADLFLFGMTLCTAAKAQSSSHDAVHPEDSGIHKSKHVIIIMQENRSFDSYFGTYPGAEGIPMKAGKPAVCAPNPQTGACDPPYHDVRDVNGG